MPEKSKAREAKRASSLRQRRASKRDRGDGSDKPTYRQKIRAKRLLQGSKSKDGCAPKLFMLLLPFIAGGAYLLLRS